MVERRETTKALRRNIEHRIGDLSTLWYNCKIHSEITKISKFTMHNSPSFWFNFQLIIDRAQQSCTVLVSTTIYLTFNSQEFGRKVAHNHMNKIELNEKQRRIVLSKRGHLLKVFYVLFQLEFQGSFVISEQVQIKATVRQESPQFYKS